MIQTYRFVFLCLAFLSLQYALRVKVQPGTVLTALFKVERSYKQLKKFFNELDMTATAVLLSSQVDMTAGAVLSSYPLELDALQPVSPENTFRDENTETIPPPTALYLQLGKRAVKKLPDAVLLGSLVVISTELLQRGISLKRSELPQIIADLVNSTLGELDGKLDLLSNLDWQIDPFLKSELGSLQVAPIDALERFVGTDVFTWIDKEGTFIVSRFLSNPNQVEIVNSNVKELLKLGITYLSDTLLSEKNEPKNVMELRRDRDKRWKEIVGSTSNIFIENLKLQPSEAVDKFIVESFLPSVDKSMSPLLSNLLANPEQVDAATRQIKEVIKVTTQNLVSSKSSNSQNPLEVGTTKITDELNRQVDKYGEWTSSLIQDWNEFIADVNMTVKIESISDMAPNKAVGSWLSKRRNRSLSVTDTDRADENLLVSVNITEKR